MTTFLFNIILLNRAFQISYRSDSWRKYEKLWPSLLAKLLKIHPFLSKDFLVHFTKTYQVVKIWLSASNCILNCTNTVRWFFVSSFYWNVYFLYFYVNYVLCCNDLIEWYGSFLCERHNQISKKRMKFHNFEKFTQIKNPNVHHVMFFD